MDWEAAISRGGFLAAVLTVFGLLIWEGRLEAYRRRQEAGDRGSSRETESDSQQPLLGASKEEGRMVCQICTRGGTQLSSKGKCLQCSGTGKTKSAISGNIIACPLCDGSGNCNVCGGSGSS